MNKKFVLIMLAFTITVPGFFVFSYFYLGVFHDIKTTTIVDFNATIYAGEHSGDYNKTGEQVVKTQRLLQSYGFPCEPVLLYFENAISVGKPFLRSAGGCMLSAKLPDNIVKALSEEGRRNYAIRISHGYRFSVYAQTAVALRKIWTHIARYIESGERLTFPLVQIVRADGESVFYIAR